jgi:opacity protein-like surface antigen
MMLQYKKVAVFLLLTVGLSSPLLASDDIDDKPSVGAILGDLLFARPILFATTQIGSLFYTLSLPLTLLNGDYETVAETLVVEPAQATYTRCLGCKGDNDKSKVVSTKNFVMIEGNYNAYVDSDGKRTLGYSPGWGLNLGSNFQLTDSSRFDVYLGYKDFGKPSEIVSNADYSLTSYSIINRAGTSLFKSEVYVMVKAGFHKWSEDIKIGGVKDSTNGINFVYGLGLDYKTSESLRWGLGYSSYGFEDASIDSVDVTLTAFF